MSLSALSVSILTANFSSDDRDLYLKLFGLRYISFFLQIKFIATLLGAFYKSVNNNNYQYKINIYIVKMLKILSVYFYTSFN